MIRQLVKDSKAFILQKPKLVGLSFLIWVSRSLEILLLLAYNINNMLIYRAGKWMSVFTMFQYFIDEVVANHIVRLIIIILIIFSAWYIFLYPMWISAIIHFLNQKKWNISKAIWKWTWDFFTMFELNALAFSFGAYTYLITILRLITLDVIHSWFVIWLLILWGTAVLFSSIFWQYAKFIIVEEQIGVFEAIKKSVWLTINNMFITIKWLIIKIMITILFYFKLIIIISIPLLISYFLLSSNIINGSNERIIRVLWIASLILASYILTTTQAFFMTFWHKIYKHILNRENDEDNN
jgi:hypothetical protein